MRGALVASGLLALLAILELIAYNQRGAASVIASRLWVSVGIAATAWLVWVSVSVIWKDLRSGKVWFFLPILLAFPLCFNNLTGYGELNTESLSELQHALEGIRKTDWGHFDVFWTVYPSRSFLPSLVPTLAMGMSPQAYRIGFSLPLFLGLLFFQTGLRRYFDRHFFSSALAALGTGAILIYPMVTSIGRTFEMAISSLSYGLWALGAMMVMARTVSPFAAVATAWTIGLRAASFTPGLALVGLFWALLVLWVLRAARRRDTATLLLVSATLFYVTVIGIQMYLLRDNPLRPKNVDLAAMVEKFRLAVVAVLSLAPSQPFTPAILVFPTVATVAYALSVRGGLVPVAGILWCLPVLWSTVNMHGKVAPELPIVLYRALVIIPVVVFCMIDLVARFSTAEGKARWLWRAIFVASFAAFVPTALSTYEVFGVFAPRTQAIGEAAVIEDLLEQLPALGLTPYSDAVIAEQTGIYEMQRLASLSQYFLPGWTRPRSGAALFLDDPDNKRPGVLFVLSSDPRAAAAWPGYSVRADAIAVRFGGTGATDLVRLTCFPSGEQSPRREVGDTPALDS
jgi:hypothetical protein